MRRLRSLFYLLSVLIILVALLPVIYRSLSPLVDESLPLESVDPASLYDKATSSPIQPVHLTEITPDPQITDQLPDPRNVPNLDYESLPDNLFLDACRYPLMPTASESSELNSGDFLGHLPYQQADPQGMIVISSYALREYQRFERLKPEAALALMQMIYAARHDNVWIVPVSGFRTVACQETLFQIQIRRQQGSEEAAAQVTAPPGYSEHHTGSQW